MVYKILILEDNEMDADLMQQHLKRADRNYEVQWVSTGEKYEEVLQVTKPDVIVSDFRLKAYSGLDAIHYKNLHCEEVPLIIVSGTIGEEKAVDIIKEGATDFLIKNNIGNRLEQKISRALKEALERERRRKNFADRIEAEKKLQSSLKEKETLLMEIHHRVKNNLAVISGLMELQLMETKNDELRNRLIDSQSRIKSIALTHELLYREQSFSNVNYRANVQNLVENVAETMNTNVKLSFDLDPVELNINQALPASLIINEMITNAFRHAFSETEDAAVHILLKQEGEAVHLRVTDNGKGMPEPPDLEHPETIGFKLISILTKQLNGQLEINTGSGTEFHLQFEKSQKRGSGSSIIEGE